MKWDMTKLEDRHAKSWDNYWAGRASHESGNALIEVGVEKNNELRQFWRAAFADQSKNVKLIDFACGAGSVLEHAHKIGIKNLTGLDVSPKALEVMKEKIPGALGICAPVNKTGLAEASYDMAVSQFGIEYAGNKNELQQAFIEIFRVLKPSGQIIIVAHSSEGLIIEGCQSSLRQIKVVENSRFLETSKEVFEGFHDPSKRSNTTEFSALTHRLNEAAKPIMDWLQSIPDLEEEKKKNEFVKFAYHLLESSHRLITNYERYAKADGIAWFNGIKKELLAYKDRMVSMTKAALSENDILNLKERLTKNIEANIHFEPLEKLYFASRATPAAWIIRAQKLP